MSILPIYLAVYALFPLIPEEFALPVMYALVASLAITSFFFPLGGFLFWLTSFGFGFSHTQFQNLGSTGFTGSYLTLGMLAGLGLRYLTRNGRELERWKALILSGNRLYLASCVVASSAALVSIPAGHPFGLYGWKIAEWSLLLPLVSLCLTRLHSASSLRFSLHYFAWTISLVALWAVVQHFSGVDSPINQGKEQWLINEHYIRANGFFSHPNLLAGFLVVTMPILYYLLWETSPSTQSGVAVACAFLLSNMAIVSTGTRLALIGSLILLGLNVALGLAHGRKQWILEIVFLLVLGILPFVITGTLFSRFVGVTQDRIFQSLESSEIPAGEDPSFSIARRIVIYSVAFRMLADHPILGVGDFNQHVPDYLEWSPANDVVFIAHPHSLFLYVWLTAGLPTLVCFVLVLILLFRENRPWLATGSNFLAVSITLSFLVMGLFDMTLEEQLLSLLVLPFLFSHPKIKAEFASISMSH